MIAERGLLGSGVERLAAIGLLLFAPLALPEPEACNLGLILVLVALIADPNARSVLARDRLFAVALVLAAYILLRSAWAVVEVPALANDHLIEGLKWLRLLLFVGLALVLARSDAGVAVVLMLALAGMLAKLMASGDWLRLGAVLSGEVRTGFGFRPLPLALYSSTAILGLLVLAPRLLAGASRRSRILRMAGWIVALAVLVIAFVGAQGRSALIGALLVFPLVLWARYRESGKHWLAWSTGRKAALATVAALILSMAAGTLVHVAKRTAGEQEAVSSAVRGESDASPESSLVLRFNVNRFGLMKWLERPIFGWGPDATEHLIAESRSPALMMKRRTRGLSPLNQLHNAYLEVLVRFGLVGALLLAAMLLMLVQRLWIAYRRGVAPRDYALFVFGALALMAVWSLFNSNAHRQDWQNFWLLIAAAAYSFYLRACAVSEGPT
jgi:O-antigen ligase